MRCTLHTKTESFPLVPNRPNSFDTFYVQFTTEETNNGTRIQLMLHPKVPIELHSVELVFPIQLDTSSRFLAHGFQSWSETYTVAPDANLPRLRWPATRYLKYYDDSYLDEIGNARSLPHAWTFGGLRYADGYQLLASLNERTGFSKIEMDAGRHELILKKDLVGLQLQHSFPALEALFTTKNTKKAAFEAYFAESTWKAPSRKLEGLAWTSWYYYYEKINAEQLQKALEEIKTSDLPFSLFQIDDGWQKEIGDWLQCNEKFPNGLAALVQKANAAGLTAGLWLAPFCVSERSAIFQKNPTWLLRDKKGNPIKVGKNKAWGGWYYALDFYNQGVRDYLSGVFHVIIKRWGFGMVKLDFLFAVCIQAPKGKTRGQVMHEAMEWLRMVCGDALLLACGVPLGSSFGQADICRIGGDVGLTWKNGLMRFLGHRGRVSTYASLRSTLHRWMLNGAVFLNDPDVFILREAAQKMTITERKTLLFLNAILGGVLFTSDLPMTHWDEAKNELIQEALSYQNCRVHAVEEIRKDVFQIIGEKVDGEAFDLEFDLSAEINT